MDPVVVDGHVPTSPDEIMLDAKALRVLGKRIGDTVSAESAFEEGGPTRSMRIVGRLIVARLPFQAADNPEAGAFLTIDAARSLDPHALSEAIYVRFAPGSNFDTQMQSLRRAAGPRSFAILSRVQVGSVRSVARLNVIPLALAGVVGALGVATLIHALISIIRRRRGELAILKTLGFIKSQVRSTVLWQAGSLIAVSLAIGLPSGIAAGRWGWRLFAEQLAVLPKPVVSNVTIFTVSTAALVLALGAAWLPARAAARTQPAIVLRAE